MIQPPYTLITPGKLDCPPDTFPRDGFCYKTSYSASNAGHRNMPLRPYTQTKPSWNQIPGVVARIPIRVDSIPYIDELGNSVFGAPSGYILDSTDNSKSDIDLDYFNLWAQSNSSAKVNYEASTNYFPIPYNSHKDHIINNDRNISFGFDARMTYPKDFNGSELCPKLHRMLYKAKYGIWYGEVFLQTITIHAMAGFGGYLGDSPDHYFTEILPSFWINFFEVGDDIGGLWVSADDSNMYISANGAYAFSCKTYNSLGDLINFQDRLIGMPDHIIYDEPPVHTHESIYVAGSPEIYAEKSPYYIAYPGWDVIPLSILDGLPASNLIGLGQEVEILSVTSYQQSYNKYTPGVYNPVWEMPSPIITPTDGPSLCGSYDSPTCWARHEYSIKVPIYKSTVHTEIVGDFLEISVSLAIDSYQVRRQSFFRFCYNDFIPYSQQTEHQVNNYFMDDFWQYRDNYDLTLADYEFWQAIKLQNADNRVTFNMCLLSNTSILGDFIPIISGCYIQDLSDVTVTRAGMRYLYNAESLLTAPQWPPQSDTTIPYNPPEIGGSFGGGSSGGGGAGGTWP